MIGPDSVFHVGVIAVLDMHYAFFHYILMVRGSLNMSSTAGLFIEVPFFEKLTMPRRAPANNRTANPELHEYC